MLSTRQMCQCSKISDICSVEQQRFSTEFLQSTRYSLYWIFSTPLTITRVAQFAKKNAGLANQLPIKLKKSGSSAPIVNQSIGHYFPNLLIGDHPNLEILPINFQSNQILVDWQLDAYLIWLPC